MDLDTAGKQLCMPQQHACMPAANSIASDVFSTRGMGRKDPKARTLLQVLNCIADGYHAVLI